MRRLLLLLLILAGCAHKTPVQPPETFEQFLLRTEGATCAQLTGYDESTGPYSGVPKPDCETNARVLMDGRALAKTVYPDADTVKLSQITPLQTQLSWNTSEPFPRMASGALPGAMAITDSVTCSYIWYAFPATLRHEMTHVVGCLLDRFHRRTEEAIHLAKDADQADRQFIYEINCHNTSDDRFGDGTSISRSGRAGCVPPYSGPKNPLLEIAQ